MTVEFRYGGVPFVFDTPREADEMLALLKKRDADAARERILATYTGGKMEQLGALIAEQATTPWTSDVFLAFLDRLGEQQKNILALLVSRHRVTDEELRNALHISGNQALAGVLSGISKQAATLGITARSIFSFENFRNAGTRRSTYTVSEKFLQIATDMLWPGPDFPSDKQAQE
jgi:hypothetical protein